MIIGIESIYMSKYKDLFSKQEGKTYVTSLIGDILSSKYNKKVLIINLDNDKNKNIFCEKNIKAKLKFTINDFIEHYNFACKSKIPYKFNIDNILNNVLKINNNLELLTVDTKNQSIVSADTQDINYINYVNKIGNTHLNNSNNLNFFLYIIDVINKSNVWDYVLVDLSGYPNNEMLRNKIDYLINVTSAITFFKVIMSQDRYLINDFREELLKFDKIIFNFVEKDKDISNNIELIQFLGIDEKIILGNLLKEKFFSIKNNSKNIDLIVKNIQGNT